MICESGDQLTHSAFTNRCNGVAKALKGNVITTYVTTQLKYRSTEHSVPRDGMNL